MNKPLGLTKEVSDGDLTEAVTIGVEAYVSEAYARAERDKLWRKVWQQVGRIEELPEVGDFLTYEILDDSIVIVRVASDTLKAFHNVCMHRGRRLVETAPGARNATGKKRMFICGFHGWRYDLDGQCTHVPHKDDWKGALTAENTHLSEVKIDIWGGWIWINMDPGCEPLQDYLAPAADLLAPFQLHNMRYRWRKWGIFDCNWKVAMEAFNETYHVQATHPEFNKFGEFRGWARVQGRHSNIGYDAPKNMDENQQAKLRIGTGPDPRKSTAELQVYTWEKANTNTTETLVNAALRLVDDLPEGTPPGEVQQHWLASARRADAERGVIWPVVDPAHVGKSGTAWQIFPNFQIGHAVNNMLCYSARPYGYDPNKCVFEAAVYELFPAGQEPVTEWVFSPPTEEAWCYVLGQDFANMAAVQQGLKSLGFPGAKPNPYMERSTANLHRNLAQYMGTGAPRQLDGRCGQSSDRASSLTVEDADMGKLEETIWPDSWKTLEHGIRSGRYIDPDFARLEYAKLWNRVWQMAARLDEVPEPGDHTVYDIGDQSILVVRVDRETVKAYHNACPHRGTALAEGSGTFEKCRIVCPFHGWRWGVDGKNQYVLERQQFRNGQLRDADVALKEVKVEIFAGFIFINFDPNPTPFAEFIAPVGALIEDLAIGEMHHYWWKSVKAPANWKVAVEAFLEGYHVPATHPQLEMPSAAFIYGDDVSGEQPTYAHVNTIHETFANGHGRFLGGEKTPMAGHTMGGGDPVDAMAARLNLLVEGMDAMILREDVELVRALKGKPIPDGSTLGGEYVKALYATAAAQGRPMPKPERRVLNQWGGEVFVFPNLMILPQAGNAMMYRVRPDRFDPDSCIFEIFSTRTLPAAQPVPRAVVQPMTDATDPEQFLQIPRQDFANIPRIQKGLHTRGCKQIWLADYYEKMILNMHQEIDRYLLSGRDS